jgi:AcrR family transcriptional regulator
MQDKNLILIDDARPKRADAIKNQQLLLDTARRLFDAEGVESVSMSAIAQKAKVGKGTLYRHFSDKGELLHALLDEDMRQLQERTLNHMREGNVPVDNLMWFIEQAVSFVIHNSDSLCEAANNSARPVLQHPAQLWWRQTIMSLLTECNTQGDISYMTDVIYVMLDVSTIRFQRRSLGYDKDRILGGLHEVLNRFIQ